MTANRTPQKGALLEGKEIVFRVTREEERAMNAQAGKFAAVTTIVIGGIFLALLLL